MLETSGSWLCMSFGAVGPVSTLRWGSSGTISTAAECGPLVTGAIVADLQSGKIAAFPHSAGEELAIQFAS